MKKHNYMVDLETLGNGEDGLFVMVAIVEFCPWCGKHGRIFKKNVNWEDGVARGLKIEPAVVRWWLQQGEEARQMILRSGEPLWVVMRDLKRFIFGESVRMWSKGTGFDIAKLAYNMKNQHSELPWDFRNVFDVRTLQVLCSDIGVEDLYSLPFKGKKHDPVDDCLHQIEIVKRAYSALGTPSENESGRCCELE